jgi:aldose 1-epimerase
VAVSASAPITRPPLRKAPFGHAPDGTAVDLFTFSNPGGIELSVATYGGIIVCLRVPGRDRPAEDVVLGHDDIEGYARSASYFGAIVGRYGNRIAGGRFTHEGITHQLDTNDGRNHLHGGARGFDKTVWSAEPFERADARGLVLGYVSADGEQGYPGSLEAHVTYTLTDDDQLVIDYLATASKPTPVNLTQHTYWNLAGDRATNVLDHELTINASRFTPVDRELIPTGVLETVAGTAFDFRAPTPIGARIDDDDEQLRYAGGYDHNFVLDRSSDGLTPAARLHDPSSGRVVEIHTTEPGLQFYSGNFLDGSITGKAARVYGHRSGLCLETQHFPDSPNKPHFPSTILRPGAQYRSRTAFHFSVRRSRS